MRVISQNGKNDIPYEKSYIVISYKNHNQIIVFDTLVGDDYLTLAEYSTEEKAIKAMEMLRRCYVGKVIMNNVDVSEDFYEQLQKLFNNGEPAIISVATDGKQSKVEQFNSVFQFPQDEEIEV
jgi:hypothetical protein